MRSGPRDGSPPEDAPLPGALQACFVVESERFAWWGVADPPGPVGLHPRVHAVGDLLQRRGVGADLVVRLAPPDRLSFGSGSEAPSPGRSTAISRTPRSARMSAPNPRPRPMAAPEKNSTGAPSGGPHCAQPSLRPSGSSTAPRRSASRTP
ncbi:hypothetical protein HDA32_002135 [Spinactinospora alkalitolerans]|uniref:Uncharacterized protein n=1 Tax=Spinactinospora alkalitolerans TaxID=687207 RepID=A0A852TU84_9ACTN|nr:hypothetical protein [Spinactinospora alkalitolerans]NYE47015.1 hypothetical protein [Spinactinospora alkalitolerans]